MFVVKKEIHPLLLFLLIYVMRKMVKPLSAMVAYEHVKDQPIWVLHHRLFQTEFYDGKIFYRVEV